MYDDKATNWVALTGQYTLMSGRKMHSGGADLTGMLITSVNLGEKGAFIRSRQTFENSHQFRVSIVGVGVTGLTLRLQLAYGRV